MGNEPDALTQMKNTTSVFLFESMRFLQKQKWAIIYIDPI